MSYQPYDSRRCIAALTGPDIGLKVRVRLLSSQRVIFAGAENQSALISELCSLEAR